ncbi:MFS transporter, partial [Streptomyces sp. NPDC058171]
MVMPLGGKLVDRFGQRPVVLTACAVFLVGSLISALSSSFALMIVGRALQGTIAVMPVIAYRVFRDSLPPRVVPIALGALGTGFGVSGLLAPVIGGAFVDGLGYRSIFWFFFAFTAVLAPLSVIVLPRTPRQRSAEVGRVDILGGLLLALGIGGILLGLGQGDKWGWLAPLTLLVILGGFIALGMFVLVESRVEEPMIDLRVLRNPAVALTLTVGLVGFMACGMMAIALPQMLQTPSSTGMMYAFGLSALMVGLAQIPFGITSMVFGPLGGLLTKRFNPRAIMISSMASFAIGSMLLALAHHSLVLVLVWLCVMGVGFGLFWAAQPNLMVEAVPRKYTGVSGGIQVCSVSISTAIASAIVGAVLSSNVADIGPEGPLYNDAAFTTIFLVGAGSAVIALIISMFMR